MKPSAILAMGIGLAALGGAMSMGGKKGDRSSNRSPLNPHNYPLFETEGFKTFSINQASHDAKYAKYLKRKHK